MSSPSEDEMYIPPGARGYEREVPRHYRTPAHLHIKAIMVHLPTHILTTHMILVPLVILTPITHTIEIITGIIQGTQSHLLHRLSISGILQIPLAVQRKLKNQGVKLKRGNLMNYYIVYLN